VPLLGSVEGEEKVMPLYLAVSMKKVNQSRYRPGVSQRVLGS